MARVATSGFTLVELLVTIAILAILLAIGLPSFQDSIRSNRVATASNELIAAIALARTEAIRSTRGAGVCASNAAGTACDNTTAWGPTGMLVWTDVDNTAGFDAGDTVVKRTDPRTDVAFTVPAVGAPASSQIVFNRMGMIAGPGGVGRTMTLAASPCPSGRELLRTLTMTPVGQVNLTKGTCP